MQVKACDHISVTSQVVVSMRSVSIKDGGSLRPAKRKSVIVKRYFINYSLIQIPSSMLNILQGEGLLVPLGDRKLLLSPSHYELQADGSVISVATNNLFYGKLEAEATIANLLAAGYSEVSEIDFDWGCDDDDDDDDDE